MRRDARLLPLRQRSGPRVIRRPRPQRSPSVSASRRALLEHVAAASAGALVGAFAQAALRVMDDVDCPPGSPGRAYAEATRAKVEASRARAYASDLQHRIDRAKAILRGDRTDTRRKE